MARDWNSFFQICYDWVLIIILATISISIVSSLYVFTKVDTGMAMDLSSADGVFKTVTGLTGGAQWVWLTIITAGGLGALVVAKLTQSTNMIGVYLFSTVLWTSWIKCLSVIDIGNWVPLEFKVLFTFGVMFLYVGAIIGMLTGSG